MGIAELLLESLAPALIQALGALLKNNPTELEAALLAIVQSGVKAYEAHTGEAIDPSLLRPIGPVD